MTFRFQSRHVFLTYPRCDIPHLDIISKLRVICDFSAYTASTENHQSGEKHVHVLLRFARKLTHRDERYWDIGNHHPNIVCPRALKATREYIKKDGIFDEEGWEDPGKPYSRCLADATSKEEFLAEIREHHCRDYVLSYERICAMADAHFKAPPPAYTPQFTDFLPCPALDEWVEANLVSFKYYFF